MFDPYHRWLAIPQRHRPPTYYQLLGIASDEADSEVIREAALRQVNHIRTYQTGPNAQICQTLLNEIGQARVTLLNPEKRKDYDARLGIGSGEEGTEADKKRQACRGYDQYDHAGQPGSDGIGVVGIQAGNAADADLRPGHTDETGDWEPAEVIHPANLFGRLDAEPR